MIYHVEATHGPLVFFQSGGAAMAPPPICLKDGELPAGRHGVRLGDIGGAPFYIDSDQYERWGRPKFRIDVAPGAADGFSLEGLVGMHFISSTLRRWLARRL